MVSRFQEQRKELQVWQRASKTDRQTTAQTKTLATKLKNGTIHDFSKTGGTKGPGDPGWDGAGVQWTRCAVSKYFGESGLLFLKSCAGILTRSPELANAGLWRADKWPENTWKKHWKEDLKKIPDAESLLQWQQWNHWERTVRGIRGEGCLLSTPCPEFSP